MSPASAPVIAFAIESPLALRGGVNVMTETLIQEMSARYRIVLISMDETIDTVPAPSRARLHGHVNWQFPRTSRAQARRVAEECAAFGVRLVHFQSGTFGFGNRFYGHCPVRPLARRGIKSIWTNHTFVSLFDGMCGPQKPWWFKLAFLPFAWTSRLLEIRAMETVIAVSQLGWARERHYYWPLRGRFQLIYHSRLDAASPLPAGPRHATILAVGHVAWRKGQLTLARAFARIAARFPEWRLVIVGPVVEPDYGAEIEGLIRRENLAERIDLMGGQSAANEFMRTAGIFVQPSIWEGLPLSLQEALFLGCPCVATRCDGNIELIDWDKNGLMVEPEDPDAMSAALERLIADPGLRARLSAAGRPSILQREMTLERMLTRHTALYDRVLENGAAEPPS